MRAGGEGVRMSGFDLNAPDHLDRWVEQTDAIRAEGPIGWSEADGGYWVAVGYDSVVEITKNWEVFSCAHDKTGAEPRARGIGIPPFDFAMLLSESDPPRQTKLRLLEIPFFQPSKMKAQMAIVQGHIDACLAALDESREVDLFRDYAMPVVALTTMALVGIDIAQWKDFTLKSFHDGGGPDFDLNSDTNRVHQMLLDLIHERRAAPQSDIVSALVEGTVLGEHLDDGEVLSMLHALVLGGFDTTAGLITSGLIWLDQHREDHDRLRADDALMANAVHEFIRYWPTVVGGARNIMRDIEMGGRKLRDGDRIYLSWAGANRDPAVFEAPHELRIDRPNADKNLTFGHGPHRCLGLELARITGRLAIKAILDRYPDYSLRREGLVRHRAHGQVAGWSFVPARMR